MQGIAVASPSVGNSTIPISVAILVVLFLFQALGTQRVGLVFAPIVGTWLALIAVSGCINIATFPGIFRAFDPSRAILWFVRTKNFDNLAGVLLCITGVEAMLAKYVSLCAVAVADLLQSGSILQGVDPSGLPGLRAPRAHSGVPRSGRQAYHRH